MTRRQESGVGKTIRFRASMRRRTSELRAMASPWTVDGQAARTASRARVRPYEATSPSRSTATASQTASHAAACAHESARPAGGTRAGLRRSERPGSRTGRDFVRASARGQRSPAGRRTAGFRTPVPGAAEPGARPRPGREWRPPTSAARGQSDDIPDGRRLPGILERSRRERPTTADEPGQTQASHDQPDSQRQDAGQPD